MYMFNEELIMYKYIVQEPTYLTHGNETMCTYVHECSYMYVCVRVNVCVSFTQTVPLQPCTTRDAVVQFSMCVCVCPL